MSDDYRGERDRYEDGAARRSQSPGQVQATATEPVRGDDRNEARGSDRGRDNRAGADAQNPGMNLHVSGLSHSVTADVLQKYFSTVGEVDKSSIMYDPHTKDSRGFGFVMMADADGASRAVAELSGKEFEGKVMNVAYARRARARTPTPGRYYGPPKTGDYPSGGGGGGSRDRYYEPRSYDSRYSGGGRGGHGYDDRDRYDRPRYDDRREPRYDDRRGGGYERGGYEPRGYESRGSGDYRGGSASYRDEGGYDRRARY